VGAVGMNEARLSGVQMAAVVALRVVIGWHFLYEGLAKLQAPSWSAAGFTTASRLGLGLVLGCFTRLASAAGILMLLMFYLCNPPFVGYFYSIPTEGSYLVVNKNLVELAGLAVVLVTGSGRVAGLDRIIHGLRFRRTR